MTLRSGRFVGLVLATLALMVAAAHAAPNDRKTLMLRGRLVDGDGYPIAKAIVLADGSRTATSAPSDHDGRWSVIVPLGTPRDLAKAPVELHVHVRDPERGYTLGDGQNELRIDLRVEGPSDAGVLLAVRASAPKVAEIVARAFRQEGDASALVEMMFVGRERESGSDAPATLPAYESVVLAGVKAAAPAAPATPPALAKPSPAPATAPVKAPPATAAPAPVSPPPSSTPAIPSRSESPGNLARPPLSESAPGTKEPNAPPSTLPPRAPEKAKSPPRVAPPANPRSSAPNLSPPPSPVATPPASSASPNPAPASTSPAKAQAVAPPRAVASPTATAPPAADSSRSPAADTTSAGPIPWSRVEVLTPSRFRARARADSAAARRASGACLCHIEGTVEVRSDRPLSRRLHVVVKLEGAALRDSVELFMGSPRPFSFHDVPCGHYTLDVSVPDPLRFRLVTPEAMRALQCEDGRLHQIRLVLEPR